LIAAEPRWCAGGTAAATAGVGFLRGIGKLYEPRGLGPRRVTISRVQAFKTARQARSRQHHHSKFGGVGRLWSKDRAPSRLNNRRSVGPMRPKLVGVANRARRGAGGVVCPL
jgi:hypothetical protein